MNQKPGNIYITIIAIQVSLKEKALSVCSSHQVLGLLQSPPASFDYHCFGEGIEISTSLKMLHTMNHLLNNTKLEEHPIASLSYSA